MQYQTVHRLLKAWRKNGEWNGPNEKKKNKKSRRPKNLRNSVPVQCAYKYFSKVFNIHIMLKYSSSDRIQSANQQASTRSNIASGSYTNMVDALFGVHFIFLTLRSNTVSICTLIHNRLLWDFFFSTVLFFFFGFLSLWILS